MESGMYRRKWSEAFIGNTNIKACPNCGYVPMIHHDDDVWFACCTFGCESPMCDSPSHEATIEKWNKYVDSVQAVNAND